MSIKLPVGNRERSDAHAREPTAWRQRLPLGTALRRRARDWAETWEGPAAGEHRSTSTCSIGRRSESGTRVLDCGCGAGRFARMAADRGASVAGIDAAKELIEIAAERTPEGDFRVGDLEALPWPEDSFDVVTGFSSFQFADDKVRALPRLGACHEDR